MAISSWWERWRVSQYIMASVYDITNVWRWLPPEEATATRENLSPTVLFCADLMRAYSRREERGWVTGHSTARRYRASELERLILDKNRAWATSIVSLGIYFAVDSSTSSRDFWANSMLSISLFFVINTADQRWACSSAWRKASASL